MGKTPSVAPAEKKAVPLQHLRVLTAADNTEEYTIPLAYRRMENLHIVFWLFKDVAWCMGFALLGTTMIVPTLLISIVIAYRTRKYVSELCHNLAITLWIGANSFWMISEFFQFDHLVVWGAVEYKHLALVPFTAGILVLAYYYLYWKPRNKNQPL